MAIFPQSALVHDHAKMSTQKTNDDQPWEGDEPRSEIDWQEDPPSDAESDATEPVPGSDEERDPSNSDSSGSEKGIFHGLLYYL